MSWTDERRLAEAKQRTDRLVAECTNLIWTHQNIRKLVMSPAVASQIPSSYAAHAFTSLQHDLVGLAIVRLCAMWDSPALGRASIPSVLKLMEPAGVRELWIGEWIAYWNSGSIHTIGPEAWPGAHATSERSLQQWNVREFVPKTAYAFLSAARRAEALITSDQLRAAKRRRDRHLAHNLTLEAASDERGVRYGDLSALLLPTVFVVRRLQLALNGSDMDFRASFRQARTSVAELWDNTTVHISSHRRKGGSLA